MPCPAGVHSLLSFISGREAYRDFHQIFFFYEVQNQEPKLLGLAQSGQYRHQDKVCKFWVFSVFFFWLGFDDSPIASASDPHPPARACFHVQWRDLEYFPVSFRSIILVPNRYIILPPECTVRLIRHNQILDFNSELLWFSVINYNKNHV